MDSLEDLVKNYRPTKAAIDLVKSSKLALLTGVSGAGKDTIKRELLKQNPFFHEIVSHTTRSPRQNNHQLEQDGVDYHFIDEDQARQMLENQEFIEAKFVHGTIYGTSVAEIEKAKQAGKIAMTDIDVQGVAEFKNISEEAVSIFIVPPSYEIWLERLKSRYASEEEFLDSWPKRRESSIKELSSALDLPYYHFIINDDLERAVRVTGEIILREDVFYEKDNQARILAQRLLEDIVNGN